MAPLARRWLRLTLCLLLCLGVGYAGSLSTAPEIPTWYAGLRKPAWTPPAWVFPVVWTTLYALMAVALWRLWDRAQQGSARTVALTAFGVQLALNAAWSPVFFAWHAVGIALAIIIALWCAILVTIRLAARVDRDAARLLWPYAAWVTYAITLNAGVAAMN